jgi:hypothetical protein
MQINIVKKTAESYTLPQIEEAIHALENESNLTIEVEGVDEGEILTHLLGAKWILEQMTANNTDLKTEWRNFSGRVRASIS